MERTVDAHDGWIRAIINGGDGLVSCADDGKVIWWSMKDADSHSVLRAESEPFVSLLSWKSCILAACGNGKTYMIDASDSKLVGTLEGHLYGVSTLALGDGEDCSTCFSGSMDQTIKKWDLHSKECIETYYPPNQANVTALLVVGSQLYAGDARGLISMWDTNTDTLLRTLKGHSDVIYHILAYENTLYTCSEDRNVRMWKIDSGAWFYTLKKSHSDGIIHLQHMVSENMVQENISAIDAGSPEGGSEQTATRLELQTLFTTSHDGSLKGWNISGIFEYIHEVERVKEEEQRRIQAALDEIAAASKGKGKKKGGKKGKK